MPCISSIDCNMDDRSHLMALYCLHADTFHQFCISDCNRDSVHLRRNTISADFLYICDTFLVNFLTVSSFQAAADRMRRKTFCQCCIFQNLFFFHRVMVNTYNFKHTLGQGTGLVKYYIFCMGQSFQIVGSFDQNTGIAGSTDSRKEPQRNTDD